MDRGKRPEEISVQRSMKGNRRSLTYVLRQGEEIAWISNIPLLIGENSGSDSACHEIWRPDLRAPSLVPQLW
ncbi:hypothetical protein L484_026336 [Morus notabilis]|uniref:Uncharacterized protein n=1 Tax=Morus notabilis TaxID=981085 RepID=W9RL37_9ROSA|nr:hypothetical protein L484_026336 [Morus notabilis]